MKWEITLGDPEQPQGVKIVRAGEDITGEIRSFSVDVNRDSAPMVVVDFFALPEKNDGRVKPRDPRDPQNFGGKR